MNDIQANAPEISSTALPEWARDPAAYTSLLMSHPLITGRVLLPTRPIEIFCSKVYRGVLLRQQGLCFTAMSGTGKTSALFYARNYLQSHIPDLVVYTHFTRNYQVPSIRAFFKFFLDTVGVTNLSGETPNLRKRLVSKIVDDTCASRHQMAVMFIDEAQKMSIQDFYFLKDVVNDLDKARVGLVTILMAQAPDFDAVYSEMKSNHQLDLLSRFALYNTDFLPLKTMEDIKLLFSQLDDTYYSSDFKVFWSEFFFPLAFSNGFRLAAEAKRFFESYAASCVELGQPVEFPARQTFFVIRVFMTDYSGYDAPQMSLPTDRWDVAIREGKVLEALEVINQSAGDKS